MHRRFGPLVTGEFRRSATVPKFRHLLARLNRRAGWEGTLLTPHLRIPGKLRPAGHSLLDRTPRVAYDYVEEVGRARLFRWPPRHRSHRRQGLT